MKRLALTLLITAALPALAESGRLVDLQIEHRDGLPYPEYHGRGATWVAGDQGEPYQLTVRNKTGERVMVVLSVDGVNAVNGKTARSNQTGYVLGPWQAATITGWRKSMNEVAQFYFTDLPDSYAARTDRPDNVGIIGAAVFRERQLPPPPPPAPVPFLSRNAPAADMAGAAEKSAAGAPASRAAAPAAASPAPAQQLGTGHGEIEHSEVTMTDFDRASSHPNEVLTVRYDSRRNLVLAGILPNTRHPLRPQAFPDEGFVPDPPRNPG
jgi:hypothetical protein